MMTDLFETLEILVDKNSYDFSKRFKRRLRRNFGKHFMKLIKEKNNIILRGFVFHELLSYDLRVAVREEIDNMIIEELTNMELQLI